MKSLFDSGVPVDQLRKDVKVHNNRTIAFQLVVLDKEKRFFHNFSTLAVTFISTGQVRPFPPKPF